MLSFLKRFARRTIYMHEDDLGNQELLPVEASEFVASELGELDAFDRAHRAPDGMGWTAVYVRRDPPVLITSLAIELAAVECVMPAAMARYDAAYTGYSTQRERLRDTVAWGVNNQCACFVTRDKAEQLTEIYFNFSDPAPGALRAATECVNALGRIKPMIYVDWSWGYWCKCSDADAFESKLNAKLTTIAARLNAMRET